MISFNDLPFLDISPTIFKHLSLKDLHACRQVSKKFKYAVDKVQVQELVVTDFKKNSIEFWFQTRELIDFKNPIKMNPFLSSRPESFQLQQTLKKLYFHANFDHEYNYDSDDYDELDFLNERINQMIFYYDELIETLNKYRELEHLELSNVCPSFIRRNLSLPNLKVLLVFEDRNSIYSANQMILDTPKLLALRCNELNQFEFRFPNTITLLHLDYIKRDSWDLLDNLTDFTNLEVLVLNDFQNCDLDRLFKLKMLHFVYFNYDALYSIKYILSKRDEMKRSDLNVYLFGVRLNDIIELEEYKESKSVFKFQIQNYDQLKDDFSILVATDRQIDYETLLSVWPTKESVPKDFFSKFINEYEIKINSKVKNSEYFQWFLSKLKYVNKLKLSNTSLDQSFYDSLSTICRSKLH